ncbi:hypothetical protein DSCO28_72840 (plasmid) [Desulfosarcina ovata subsp. sediminis]|uniref:NTF2 fold domain-containing protein n=1 Tax=Desulfosarcina ovata subsp. sediminis TaxID=885957 RepID=A0A5K8A2S8_9BACT|nr:hypothetical protein [Desulfosarcina ovata]BBO86718.1 hypothetical protein DSCO28_72840 [Desulfosarcina ovata subsp. sediminis]
MKHPTIDRNQALRIAQQQYTPPKEAFEIYDEMPANWIIYGGDRYNPDEHWFIQGPIRDGIIGGSRVIIISRETGEVVYDGPAGE